MKGHRMSSLPIAQYCAQAPRLSQVSASRAAVQSSAFHARCAGDPKGDKLVALLTPEERAEMESWAKPADVTLPSGVTLRYDDAVKELAVALDENGCATDNEESALTVGHLDLAWVVHVDGAKVAYVGDIKRTAWSCPDGPESLQLHAYGQAFADKHGCDAYVPGLWLLDEEQWQWGALRDLLDFGTLAITQRIVAAAGNADEDGYHTGPHCRSCYGRMHCPAHMLPVSDPVSALEPLTKPDALDDESALSALLLYQSAQDLMKKVKDNLEAYAERNGGISDGNGKIWAKCMAPGGSPRFDAKRFEKERPDLANQYITHTKPKSMGFRWVKRGDHG